MEYKVVSASSEGELQSLVNDELQNGFKPVGGVSVVHYEQTNNRKGYVKSEWLYTQALFKEAAQQSVQSDGACESCKLQFTSSCPSLLGKRCQYYQPRR